MKINEIINEGPMWDKLKSTADAVGGVAKTVGTAVAARVPGTAANANAIQNTANAATAKPISDATKRLITDWTALSAQLKANGNPVDLTTFSNWMKQRTPSVAPPTPADIVNPQAIAAYIAKSVSQHFANSAAGQSTATNQNPTQGTTQDSAERSVPGAPGGGVASGVSLIHTEPDIIRYGKRDFVQNDQGQWSPTNSNQPVNQGMQAFFTKQATALTGGETTDTIPQSQPGPAPSLQRTPAQIRAAKQVTAGAAAQRQMGRTNA